MPLSDRLYLIGTCMVTNLKNAAKVQVKNLELDENLLVYFPRRRTLYAHNKTVHCKPGDIVLIKELPEQMTKEITHEVVEKVYELGNIIDPLTGRKIVNMRYDDELEKRYKQLGDQAGGYLKSKQVEHKEEPEQQK